MPELRHMPVRWLLAVELVIAGAILATGIPIAMNALAMLSVEAHVASVANADRGGRVPADTIEEIAAQEARTDAQRKDLALTLLELAGSDHRTAPERKNLIERAILLFRAYVARVPGDGAAWAGLASAELAGGDPARAVRALEASILAKPWSPSLVTWRCRLGFDLFPRLDDEGRELMKGQLRLEARRSASRLVQIAINRNAVRTARILLASSPDELILFEAELGKRR